MNARRLVMTVLCALSGALLFGASAQATLIRPLLSSFGSFSSVQSVTVDQATGDVYVLDAGDGTLSKFDASGNPVDFSSLASNTITGITGSGGGENEIAVDRSAGPAKGDIYVASYSAGSVSIYGTDGTKLGELSSSSGSACGVAVDPTGNVYVGIYPGTVNKYTPAANPVKAADQVASMEGLNSICNVAVDGAGDLYAATYSGGLTEYEASQFGSNAASGTLIDRGGSTLALDPTSNDVYIDEGSDVAEYDSTGSLIGRFGAGVLSGSYGVAVNHASQHLYVSDGASHVAVFGPTEVQPDVITSAPSAMTETSATLNGTVNPGGVPVSACEFEYGTEEGVFPSTVACSSLPGAGSAPVAVSADITGLALGGTYHYRLKANNANTIGFGQEAAFTVFTAAQPVLGGPFPEAGGLGLPDDRGYEQVTPVDKGGYDALTILVGAVTQSSASGDAFMYESTNAYGATKLGLNNTFLSTRAAGGAGGWSTASLQPAYDEIHGGLAPQVAVLTPEFTKSAQVESDPEAPLGAPAGPQNVYLHDDLSGSNLLMSPGSTENPSGNEPSAEALTSDGSHVVFRYPMQLGSEVAANGGGLYDFTGGRLHLIGQLTDGTPIGNASLGNTANQGAFGNSEHALSEDGSRAFFVGSVGGSTGLFVRENDTTTVEVSESQRAVPDPAGSGSPAFVGASADGSVVFFLDKEKLTNDSTASSAANQGDLYRFDVDTHELTDLTVDRADPNGADLLGVMKVSNDGSYVYFVAHGVLAGVEAAAQHSPIAGQPNIYQWHAGQLRYITTLSSNDVESQGGDWSEGIHGNSTSISSDGAQLEFQSRAHLTGYENAGHFEIYLYDSNGNQLTCVSCNPSGAPATGDATIGGNIAEGITVPYVPPVLAGQRMQNLSADGKRVFFDTTEALVSQDTNGQEDVYEWEGGRVYLISTGQSANPSVFVGAGDSGDDVFFETRQQLVAQDTDNLVDIYDARVDGGTPRVPSPPACSGTGCQGIPAVPPIFATPPSVTFSGVGNFEPAAKATPKVKKHSKAKQKHKTKAKKHSKAKKHAGAMRKHKSKAKKSQSRRAGR